MTPNPNPSPELHEAAYLIRKGGYFYRPNAQGYTTSKAEAGRYTLAEAWAHSHPNGPTGPRDGIDYMLDDEPAPPTCPACDGTKVVSQGGHDTGCDACYVCPQALPAPGEETCPVCEGKPMPLGSGCMAGCRDGTVLTTSANVLRNMLFWYRVQEREIAELRAAPLATVVAANDEGVASANEYRTDYQIGKADGIEAAAKVADDYEQHTGDPAFDAATDVAAVTIAERIRLLSQGEGEARSEGWTEKGHEWLDAGAPLPTSRKDDAS